MLVPLFGLLWGGIYIHHPRTELGARATWNPRDVEQAPGWRFFAPGRSRDDWFPTRRTCDKVQSLNDHVSGSEFGGGRPGTEFWPLIYTKGDNIVGAELPILRGAGDRSVTQTEDTKACFLLRSPCFYI